MNYDQIKSYFLSIEGVTLVHPYGERADVFEYKGKKVGVLTSDNEVINIFLKCNPSEALALRDIYHSIVPSYQCDKKHWNTLIVDGSLPDKLIRQQIDGSFDIVRKTLGLLQQA